MSTQRTALAAASPLAYLYDDLDRLTQATNPQTISSLRAPMIPINCISLSREYIVGVSAAPLFADGDLLIQNVNRREQRCLRPGRLHDGSDRMMKCMQAEKNRKVLIATVQFYPDPTPRGNRVFELARGFAQRGWSVEVLLFWDDRDRTAHQKLTEEYGIAVDYLCEGPLKEGTQHFSTLFSLTKKQGGNPVKSLLNFSRIISRSYWLLRAVFKLLMKFAKQPAVFISVSNPLYVHLFSAWALRFFPARKFTAIAEYGDAASPAAAKENQFISEAFDRIVVMSEKMRGWYGRFKEKKDIVVIPHGFNLREVKKAVYKKNEVPTFAYAGRFWKEVRDPTFFFEFLKTCKFDFKFYVYWNDTAKTPRTGKVWIYEMFSTYKALLGERFIVKEPLSRLELIYELSRQDFLVDFSNLIGIGEPSKLIDYTLAERPVLSVNQSSFRPEVFESFIHGQYEQSVKFDLSKHDIDQVIDRYLEVVQRGAPL